MLTVEDIAETLHVTQNTARRMMRQNQIPGVVKIGKRWLLEPDIFNVWLKEICTKTVRIETKITKHVVSSGGIGHTEAKRRMDEILAPKVRGRAA